MGSVLGGKKVRRCGLLVDNQETKLAKTIDGVFFVW